MTIHAPHDKWPVVAYEKISDDEVKWQTGFANEKLLVSFIFIVNNGAIQYIKKNAVSVLTWYKEWFFYFE